MEEPIEVMHSKVEGFGVFATRKIRIGEIICYMRGEIVNIEELKKLYQFKYRIDDPLQISDNSYLILKVPYIFINHSCSPNACIRGINTLLALREIKKGEEITFDYSLTEWSNDKLWKVNWKELWKVPCNCKSKNCRGFIRVFPTLPHELIMNYYSRNALQDHILVKLKNYWN
jgi:SET domain-containing protein